MTQMQVAQNLSIMQFTVAKWESDDVSCTISSNMVCCSPFRMVYRNFSLHELRAEPFQHAKHGSGWVTHCSSNIVGKNLHMDAPLVSRIENRGRLRYNE